MKPLWTRLKVSSRQLILSCVALLVAIGVIGLNHPDRVNASNTLTFVPAADSYVNQSDPTRNFGSSTSIRVDGSPLLHGYLRFDVIGIGSNLVTKVTLNIYANSSSSAGITVNKVDDNNWQETGITYNNAPPPGSRVGASDSFSGNTWVNIDVTPLLNTDGAVSIALLGINQTAINLAARENSNYAPQLLVEITGPADATATDTITQSATPTWTSLPSATATNTIVPSATATSTVLPSTTPSPPATASPVPSVTPTLTATVSPIPSNTPTLTATASPVPSNTPTLTATVSPIPSSTPTLTATASPVPSVTPTLTPTVSPIPSSTPPLTATASPVPSNTSTPTATASPVPSSTPPLTATASPVPSSTLTFIPVADSYVVQSDPTRNYGSKHSLRVDDSPLVRAYLRFDIIGIDSNPVTKVTLKIYASSSSSAGFTVNKVDDNNWVETGITYNNAPVPGSQVGASNGFPNNSWVEIDVTPLLNSDGIVSIVLLGINQTAINLAARENSSYTPQLLVEISEPGEATATWTLEPSATAIPTDLPSVTPKASPIPNATPTPTYTASPVPSATPALTATASPNPSGTPTPTATASPSPSFTLTWTPSPAPTNDPIIFFVGDLVSGTSVSRAQAVVNLIQTLMSQHPGTEMLVASVGDNEQESSPTISNYESYFGTTYGSFVTQGIFMQVRGNHDIQSAGSYTDFDGQVHSTGAAYWDYFGSDAHMFDIDGKKLTDYSYDLGAWHIVALDQLNGNVNHHTLNFLTTDLAFHASSTCQMVYWHVPTYSSGASQGDMPGLKPLNQAEYDAGVDIQLNGHDHDYQRFFPINPDGVQDDQRGITTFVVGIGGQDGNSGSKTSIAQAASAVYMGTFPPGASHAIGVVQFTLHAGSADYQLYDANDGSILDQGTVNCH
jgi:regulation of enolase protein 1 (concanavalin A-like superfamily)